MCFLVTRDYIYLLIAGHTHPGANPAQGDACPPDAGVPQGGRLLPDTDAAAHLPAGTSPIGNHMKDKSDFDFISSVER